jgi:hypothetical protein
MPHVGRSPQRGELVSVAPLDAEVAQRAVLAVKPDDVTNRDEGPPGSRRGLS